MIERYTLTVSPEEIKKQLNVDPTPGYKHVFNAAPTHLLPVITHLQPEGFSFFYWGLPPEMTKNKPISRKLINASTDQIASKISYKNALLKRRCLIPADGFYLWKQISKKGKVPYRFIFNNEEVFMIAGIWEEFDSENSTDTHTFSMIINTARTDNFKTFSESIPAIIRKSNVKEWLSSDTQEDRLIKLLNDYPKEEMGFYPVSSMISNIHLNDRKLIKPSKPVDQFGNYSLFD
jgi:putative SOS response-associated peptidase YedK